MPGKRPGIAVEIATRLPHIRFHAAQSDHLEHQLGAPAHRSGRQIHQGARPDVLCLQETKCPDDAFPLKRFRRLGYEHIAINGQKGYHGVAVLSRLPFEISSSENFCGKIDCRHIVGRARREAGLKDPLTLHNYYVPAGGDEPDPADQSEIRAQARNSSTRWATAQHMRAGAQRARDPGRRSQRRAARARRVESQADVQGRLAHADRMREARPPHRRPATGSTRCASSCREPEKLFTWWSYRAPDWATADKGRRLDHIWVSDGARRPRGRHQDRQGLRAAASGRPTTCR